VRFHLLGQAGPRYCGTYYRGSHVSDINKMMVVFRSDKSTVRRGFRAKLSFLRASDIAYAIHDRGFTYTGQVNYTVRYKACLRWDKVRRCPIGFDRGQYRKGLGRHNYCRNPTRTEQPWCYTDAKLCAVDFCDVSGLYTCHDISARCAQKIIENHNYCSQDPLAFEVCHKTCGFCEQDENSL